MTNKEVEREILAAGFSLVRNGSKHAIYCNGTKRITVGHGRLSNGAICKIKKACKK